MKRNLGVFILILLFLMYVLSKVAIDNRRHISTPHTAKTEQEALIKDR